MKGYTVRIPVDPNESAAIIEYDRPVSLKELKAAVGGWIELVPLFESYDDKHCVAFCNEEGKLNGLPVNTRATKLWHDQVDFQLSDVLVGSVVVCHGDDEFMAAL